MIHLLYEKSNISVLIQFEVNKQSGYILATKKIMNETNHTYKIIQNGQKANEQYILFITVQIQKWSSSK